MRGHDRAASAGNWALSTEARLDSWNVLWLLRMIRRWAENGVIIMVQ